jgi:hypothetical protein
LWTYEQYQSQVDGYTTGPEGQERDVIESHLDANMLGFDATIIDKYGQRLKFSMIGKMSANKITGVFLNYGGASGTWTAVRSAKADSSSSPETPATPEVTPITSADVAYHDYAGYSNFSSQAGIQGTVQLVVTTNGRNVTNIKAESGNPFLVRDASLNLRTWRFTDPTPRTFRVPYSYEVEDVRVKFLEEPGVVEVNSIAPMVEGGGSNLYNPPHNWQAELTSSRGTIHLKLSLAISDEISENVVDGYMEGSAIGEAGKKEAILESHIIGDMLGFDAKVKGPDGKPIKISVIGKKSGNNITGVFLDESGTPGTWTAVRLPSHSKPSK